MQLLMQQLGLGLAEVGQAALLDGDVLEAARHHQADSFAGAGQDGVEHPGAAVERDRAGAMDRIDVRFDRRGGILDRLDIAAGFVSAAGNRFSDLEASVGLDQNRVGHGPARIEGEDVIARGVGGRRWIKHRCSS